jgi:hypothetical protein
MSTVAHIGVTVLLGDRGISLPDRPQGGGVIHAGIHDIFPVVHTPYDCY